MSKLNDNLKSKINKLPEKKKRRVPLWQGPKEDGITVSLLSRFLVCRERFRLKVIEGLGPKDQWNHKIGYGNMWHLCEETYAKFSSKATIDLQVAINRDLEKYAKDQCKKYPMSQTDIIHWYNVCLIQFPEYIKYWREHPDNEKRTPLLQEKVFNIPYTLPSGDVVRLRGKFDSVDLIEGEGVYLQENKTKGQINQNSIRNQLSFDLQTMFYLIALQEWHPTASMLLDSGVSEETVNFLNKARGSGKHEIAGVRYNVVRRPLSGGKGTIRQTKNETKEQYYDRLRDYIREEPEHYFMRWKSLVSRKDIENFKLKFLDPILTQLVHWYTWISSEHGINHPWDNDVSIEYPWDGPETISHSHSIHWQMPYGVFNPLSGGGTTEYDGYLENGSELGLEPIETLYPELEEN